MDKPSYIPDGYRRIHVVDSLSALFNAQFDETVNGILYPRSLSGDFNRLANYLDEKIPCEAPVGAHHLTRRKLAEMTCAIRDAGMKKALDAIFEDMDMLDETYMPGLRLIKERGYGRNIASTDIHLFHRDGVTYPLGRLICVYNGPVTEVLCNEDSVEEGRGVFRALPEARIFSFRPGDLWRQSGDGFHKDEKYKKVTPFIHRAPIPKPGDPPRLMLVIS